MTENSESRPFVRRALVFIVLATFGGLAAIYFGISRTAFEKFATALAMPCGVIWYALGCNVVFAVAAKQKKLMLIALAVFVGYSVAGNGHIARSLSRQIEAPFKDIRPLQEQPFDYVVVLGGGGSTGPHDRHQGGDRLVLAAQLYHAGLAKQLICTGKKIAELSGGGVDPAVVSNDVLTKLGVPEVAIEMFGGRTTAEEMASLGKRFSSGDDRVGVVTSAWHLRRAIRLANRNDFFPEPLPADFLSGPDAEMTVGEILLSCCPSSSALHTTTKIGKEYLGALVGR